MKVSSQANILATSALE